mgnify:CR=1 FL=1
MHKYLGILAAAMMVACGSGDGDGDSGTTGDDDDDDNGCQDILEFFPADGETAVYYRTAIEFTLESTDGSEVITVDGATGTSTIVDNKVVFTPDTVLSPSTSYNVTLDWCGGPTSTTWTTSAVGGAADEADLIGSTFALDLGSGRFVTPAGIGPLIQQQLEQPILIGVVDITGTDLQMMGALGLTDETQDMCSPSIDFPVAADFSENPYFVIGPDAITLDIEGIEILIEDMVISGAFAPDGTYVAGATLAGAIDTRPLAGLVGATGDDNAICDLVVTFGVACEACPDQSNFCLSVFVDNMQADGVPGSLVPVDQAAIDANTDCG